MNPPKHIYLIYINMKTVCLPSRYPTAELQLQCEGWPVRYFSLNCSENHYGPIPEFPDPVSGEGHLTWGWLWVAHHNCQPMWAVQTKQSKRQYERIVTHRLFYQLELSKIKENVATVHNIIVSTLNINEHTEPTLWQITLCILIKLIQTHQYVTSVWTFCFQSVNYFCFQSVNYPKKTTHWSICTEKCIRWEAA